MSEITDRRGFLELIIKGSAFIIGAVTVVPALGLLMAPVFKRSQRKRSRVIFARPEDAASNVFVSARLDGNDALAPGVFYRRAQDGKPIVLSSVCTHAGCPVTWYADQDRFLCPCHGGTFDGDGKNISGPPPKPLTRLVAIAKGNEILVEEPEV
jgi:Rieske Fe-S protein